MAPKVIHLVRDTLSGFANDDGPLLGAGLAYYGLLSMAPLVLVIVSVLSAAVGDSVARAEVQAGLREWIGPSGTRAVRDVVLSANDTGAEGFAALLGSLVLLWYSTRLFSALHKALNRVFGVIPAREIVHHWLAALLLKRLLGLLLILLLGAVLIGSVFAHSMLLTATRYASGVMPVPALLFYAADNALLCLVLAMGITLVMASLPDVHVRIVDVMPGALLTAFMLVVAKYLIGWYLGTAGVASTFGAAGAIIGVLFWMVWSAQCFLLGAEFTKVWATTMGRGYRPSRGYRFAIPAPSAEE